MTVLLFLLLSSQFPSATETAWMEPSAFHLLMGDSRENVSNAFDRRGWKLEPGERADTLVHPYDDTKNVVLEFRDDRLTSIRFELVSFHPQLARDWAEVKKRLRERFGEPEVSRPPLVLQRTAAFTIHAVLNDSPDSELGKAGAGMIIVRYFVPDPSADPAETSR